MKNKFYDSVARELNRIIAAVSQIFFSQSSKKKNLANVIINLKNTLVKKQKQVNNLVNLNNNLKKYNTKLYQQKIRLKEINKRNRNAINKKNEYYKIIKNRSLIPIINNIHNFAQKCTEIGESIKADVYLSHDDFPLLAARMLSCKYGGKIFYDAIEVPEHINRTGVAYQKWPTSAFFMIDHLREGIAPYLSGIMTVSDPLADRLKDICSNVVCIENYRYFEKFVKSDSIRNKCKISNEDKLILFMNHITPNYYFEEVLKALCLLPKNYYLATLGRIVPKSYYEQIKKLVKSMDLDLRVVFLDPVPYNELTSFASGADVGLIVRDINVINNKISLPNRLFDYIFSHVPICSSPIPHIVKLIRQFDIGDVFQNHSSENIAETIFNVVNRAEYLQTGLNKASHELTWDKKEKQLIRFLDNPDVITILGIKDLTMNNRTLRIALTLANNGTKVNIVTTKPYTGDMNSKISWFYIQL